MFSVFFFLLVGTGWQKWTGDGYFPCPRSAMLWYKHPSSRWGRLRLTSFSWRQALLRTECSGIRRFFCNIYSENLAKLSEINLIKLGALLWLGPPGVFNSHWLPCWVFSNLSVKVQVFLPTYWFLKFIVISSKQESCIHLFLSNHSHLPCYLPLPFYYFVVVLAFFFFLRVSSTSKVELELTMLRSKVACLTDWTS